MFDSTFALARQGYAWLPNLRRKIGGGTVNMRLLGRPAVGLCGPAATRFFYDEGNIHRHGALPGPVRDTLFGRGGVHSLDGVDHRLRKAMFMALLTGDGVTLLQRYAADGWDTAVTGWASQGRAELFEQSSRVLTRAVCQWAGVHVDEADLDALAADLVSMVDGFATPGPRHWRARQARRRRERWLAAIVAQARAKGDAPAGSALAAVAEHADAVGAPLDEHVAAVELLNVLRPTVAVCWFVTFAGHALHRWPEHRQRLGDGDPAYAEAFAHELRRFYPFAPFVGGHAARDLDWDGDTIPAGTLVLLDLYGQNHDPLLWPDPYGFAPGRFLGRTIDPFELIPQGGGDPRTGHRCPGEIVTVALLRTLLPKLARLAYTVPAQNLSIPLHRIPTRPTSGLILSDVQPSARVDPVVSA
jgi:fatty-acid peroxygenase